MLLVHLKILLLLSTGLIKTAEKIDKISFIKVSEKMVESAHLSNNYTCLTPAVLLLNVQL